MLMQIAWKKECDNDIMMYMITSKKKDISFRDSVYDVVAAIPRGKVMSYGEVARRAGSPRAARAVGSLMNSDEDFHELPCHRVILASRHVGVYAGGPEAKAKLLRAEGVIVENLKVLEEQMM
jgi:O-6-methylguanine DNA methyltransferase